MSKTTPSPPSTDLTLRYFIAGRDVPGRILIAAADDVYGLRKSIIAEEKLQTPPTNLTLFKVGAWTEEQCQQWSGDESVVERLHDNDRKLHDIWTSDPTNINIIAVPRALDTAQTSVNDLALDETGEAIQALCNKFWNSGKSGWDLLVRELEMDVPELSEHLTVWPLDDDVDMHDDTGPSAAEKVQYKIVDVGDVTDFFPFDRSKILLRDEYLEMYDHLQMKQAKTSARGIAIIGQPGIGKSFFLYYALLRRIVEGKTTALQDDQEHVLMVRDGTVVMERPGKARASQHGDWALVD